MSVSRNKRDFWYERAKTWRDFINLIGAVDDAFRREEKKGAGKLKKNIRSIRSRGPFSHYPLAFLPRKGEAVFIGDTHGDSSATLSIVNREHFVRKVKSGKPIYLVFLGDYADRGKEDVKNLEVVLNLKWTYPKNVYLLRGNHEETAVGQSYGLLGSCIRRFGYENGQYIFQRFNDLFERFPGALVTGNGVVAVHGGVPVSGVASLEDLNDESVLTEMRWNDPSEETEGYQYNFKRGGGYLFGEDAFKEFMDAIKGSVLVRSHEYVSAGYKMLFQDRLLTVFSNGGSSRESGYKDFILYPKYAKVDLSENMKRWSTKHVLDVRY